MRWPLLDLLRPQPHPRDHSAALHPDVHGEHALERFGEFAAPAARNLLARADADQEIDDLHCGLKCADSNRFRLPARSRNQSWSAVTSSRQTEASMDYRARIGSGCQTFSHWSRGARRRLYIAKLHFM